MDAGELTIGLLLGRLKSAGFTFDFEFGVSGNWTLKVYDYSATAQAGYEYRLMYNDSSKNLERLLEDGTEWVLTHKRKQRESKRP